MTTLQQKVDSIFPHDTYIARHKVDKAIQKLREEIEAMLIPFDKFNIATQMREFNKAQERNMLLQDVLALIGNSESSHNLQPSLKDIHKTIDAPEKRRSKDCNICRGMDI